MTKRPALSKRSKARRARLRRDPFGRLCIAVGDYLASIGWSAVVVGQPAITGEGPAFFTHDPKRRPAGLSRYQFLVSFTGGRVRPDVNTSAHPRTRKAAR
jgi:hypothetical protein